MCGDLLSGLASTGICAAACLCCGGCFCLGMCLKEHVYLWVAGGVKPAGPMKSNLTTPFRQHIPLLFALQESDAWRGGSSGEG